MEAFKEYLEIKGHSKNTIHGMVLTAQRFSAWMEEENITCGSIRYADVLSYIQLLKKHNIKHKTQNNYIVSIKKYLDYLTEQGLLSSNPAAHITLHGTNQRSLYPILTIEELENLYYQYPQNQKRKMQQLAFAQNKIITGLLVWQGLRTEGVGRLTVHDLKLKEGKINIPGGRKTERRTLALMAHQIIDLMDFLYDTRKEIISRTRESDQLFIGLAGSPNINSIMKSVILQLKKQQPKLIDIQQIRASVITHWIKQYNLRKVQHMAGHRYISSTEKFKINDIEGLQEEIRLYHPIN